MSNNRIAGDIEHQEVSALIPWYVNARLPDHERLRVDAHILGCAACRADLALEKQIFEGIKATPAVEYMPAASLKRLQARLDGLQSRAPAGGALPIPRARSHWSKRGLMAASLGAVTITISLLL